jgi:hypothetical protein
MATLKGEIDSSFTIRASCLILSFSEEESTLRGKIRLIEVNSKCRHLKNRPVQVLCGRVFIRVYRLETQSVSHVGYFDPAL